MSIDSSDRDYAVGCGRPPVHSRFKPGQSGNPRGRPKGSLNFDTVLETALAAKVTITENGQRIRLSKGQLAITQLANKAAKGDPRALELVLKRFDRIKAFEAEAIARTPDEESDATQEDAELFEHVLKRFKEGQGA